MSVEALGLEAASRAVGTITRLLHMDSIWTDQLDRPPEAADLGATLMVGNQMVEDIKRLLQEKDFLTMIYPEEVSSSWGEAHVERIPELDYDLRSNLPDLMSSAARYIFGEAEKELSALFAKITELNYAVNAIRLESADAIREAMKGFDDLSGDLSPKWRATLAVLGGCLLLATAVFVLSVPPSQLLVEMGVALIVGGMPQFNSPG